MKKAVFIFLFIALWIPKFEDKLNIVKLKDLAGVYEGATDPKFNLKDWFEGKFQTDYENYKSQTFGFRNFFIRLYNQFDYSIFRKAHYNVIEGKEGYLFQGSYLDEITGENFIGDSLMKKNIGNIHTIENYLAGKGKLFFTVLAPGKSDFFREYIPEYYNKKASKERNYNSILRNAGNENINLIDLNKWFLELKDTSKLPLFPKQGIHWNFYGMALSVDTITKYIESKTQSDVPDFNWVLEFPDTLRDTDYDLGDLLNISFKLPYNKMPYPKFDVKQDSTKKKLKLLTIGDSFYWTIFNSMLFKKMFDNETYYYYCNTIYPEGTAASNCPYDLNFIKEIEKYDVIMLIQSSANYNNPGVGFVQLFIKELEKRKTYKEKAFTVIKENPVFSARAKEISNQLKITNDSAVAIVADSLVEMKMNEISTIKVQMRNNQEWMNQLQFKSNTRGVSLEEAMNSDAEWMYDQRKNPF